MQPPRNPVFVARDTYRRRRLVDALRLLPVIGLFLFLSPMIGGAGYQRATASAGIFVFAAWLGLILATFVLVRLHTRASAGPGAERAETEPDQASPPTSRSPVATAPGKARRGHGEHVEHGEQSEHGGHGGHTRP